jgi:hypothetical protein
VLLLALRRGLTSDQTPRTPALFLPVLLVFAALCVAGSAAVWGGRQRVVRRLRELSDDDLTAVLAAGGTGAASLALVGLVALALPSLSARLSRGEMDVVVVVALMLIGVLAVGLGWILLEALVDAPPPLPGKLEARLARRSND